MKIKIFIKPIKSSKNIGYYHVLFEGVDSNVDNVNAFFYELAFQVMPSNYNLVLNAYKYFTWWDRRLLEEYFQRQKLSYRFGKSFLVFANSVSWVVPNALILRDFVERFMPNDDNIILSASAKSLDENNLFKLNFDDTYASYMKHIAQLYCVIGLSRRPIDIEIFSSQIRTSDFIMQTRTLAARGQIDSCLEVFDD